MFIFVQSAACKNINDHRMLTPAVPLHNKDVQFPRINCPGLPDSQISMEFSTLNIRLKEEEIERNTQILRLGMDG